jgi:hypothetical protein
MNTGFPLIALHAWKSTERHQNGSKIGTFWHQIGHQNGLLIFFFGWTSPQTVSPDVAWMSEESLRERALARKDLQTDATDLA